MACVASLIAGKNRFHVFRVESGAEIEIGSYKQVTGLELETETQEWKTGDLNNVVKLPGTTKYPPIVLHKGFDSNHVLSDWYSTIWNASESAATQWDCYDVIIYVLDRQGNIFRKIIVKDAWPSKYSADDLDGMSSDPWLESVELQHSGWSYDKDAEGLAFTTP